MDICSIIGQIVGIAFLIFSLYLCVVIFIKGINIDLTGAEKSNDEDAD